MSIFKRTAVKAYSFEDDATIKVNVSGKASSVVRGLSELSDISFASIVDAMILHSLEVGGLQLVKFNKASGEKEILTMEPGTTLEDIIKAIENGEAQKPSKVASLADFVKQDQPANQEATEAELPAETAPAAETPAEAAPAEAPAEVAAESSPEKVVPEEVVSEVESSKVSGGEASADTLVVAPVPSRKQMRSLNKNA